MMQMRFYILLPFHFIFDFHIWRRAWAGFTLFVKFPTILILRHNELNLRKNDFCNAVSLSSSIFVCSFTVYDSIGASRLITKTDRQAKSKSNNSYQSSSTVGSSRIKRYCIWRVSETRRNDNTIVRDLVRLISSISHRAHKKKARQTWAGSDQW